VHPISQFSFDNLPAVTEGGRQDRVFCLFRGNSLFLLIAAGDPGRRGNFPMPRASK